MKWYIPDCFWPVKDQGDYLGHEAISVLNTAEKPITAHMTLYFEDREKLDGFVLEIPAERTIHFHTNELKNQDGQAIPRGVGYAAVIECSEPGRGAVYACGCDAACAGDRQRRWRSPFEKQPFPK